MTVIQLRSIVVATDLSAAARRAAERAAMLARSTGAWLSVLHVVNGSALDELRRWLDRSGPAGQSLVDEVSERTRKLADEMRAAYDIPIDNRTVVGPVVDEIVRVADEERADLVVTGTLGGGALRNQMIGSTAERVVRRSRRPVLMVRQIPSGPYRRVLVPVDLSDWSAPSVELAAAVAPEAYFVLMHVVDVPFEGTLRQAGVDAKVIDDHRERTRVEAMQGMHDLAARAGLRDGTWRAMAPDGSAPWAEVVRLEAEQQCDLIVIGKHGRNAIEELLLGSTTNRVIGTSSSDVLVASRRDQVQDVARTATG
jgi:nucleotide-binding universal stress UspA family protein